MSNRDPEKCPQCERLTLPEITSITTARACYLCGYQEEVLDVEDSPQSYQEASICKVIL